MKIYAIAFVGGHWNGVHLDIWICIIGSFSLFLFFVCGGNSLACLVFVVLFKNSESS